YIAGNRLFMIMDTVCDFDHEKDMQRLAERPRQEEWEAYVSSFQQTSAEAAADEKWQLMERIYKLDQQQEYRAAEGQLKECPYAVKNMILEIMNNRITLLFIAAGILIGINSGAHAQDSLTVMSYYIMNCEKLNDVGVGNLDEFVASIGKGIHDFVELRDVYWVHRHV